MRDGSFGGPWSRHRPKGEREPNHHSLQMYNLPFLGCISTRISRWTDGGVVTLTPQTAASLGPRSPLQPLGGPGVTQMGHNEEQPGHGAVA